MRRLILCLLVLIPLAGAAADPPAAKPDVKAEERVLPAGTIVHDLRDFLPFTDTSKGKPEDVLHCFSVKEGYFVGYRAEDSDGDGYLSRGDVIRIVGKLQASLRKNYPDVFAEIDTDGDENLTSTEILAYMTGKK